MKNEVEKFIDDNREKLKEFSSSQIFFGWANLALEQGAEPEEIMYQVMSFNIRGG